jgi:hypothetical protein
VSVDDEPFDPRANERLWAIYAEWKDAAAPDVRANLDTLGRDDIQFSGEVVDGRVTIYVSAITDRGLEQLMEVDGATIGFTVVGDEIIFSSDD